MPTIGQSLLKVQELIGQAFDMERVQILQCLEDMQIHLRQEFMAMLRYAVLAE